VTKGSKAPRKSKVLKVRAVRRKLVHHFEIMSSVMSWPVDVYLSRQSNCLTWDIDFVYTHPEAKARESFSFGDEEELSWIAEDRDMDLDEFGSDLLKSPNADIKDLGATLKSALEADRTSTE